MQDQKKDYLKKLITWTEKVEDLLLARNENIVIEDWNRWKSSINEALLHESLSDNDLLQIKKEAELYYDKWMQRMNEQTVPIGKHKLPKLPYAYNALEPYIAEEIMKLHHQKHHQSYVDGLNRAELALYKENNHSVEQKHWLREQAFHGSGHYLHTIFWFSMSPYGGGTPKQNQALLQQINKDFGSFKEFKKRFTDAANAVEGSGWAILAWSPRARRLVIHILEKHQHFALADTIPLLALDLWEHAYYLQYKNVRKEYIEAWWNVVDWDNVNKRYMQGNKVKWEPF
ncbi:Superoxide dismutase [Mn/Fe] [Paraliobacillus sp. PM-2]|uniref:superoxide dismutase n=1 Tax=Paraliobacillus sp. PM-2 TaxID=1462524 RepID=UPI00061B9874|nr:superoxide dismutase [Paraliobacillus sp. PM-2]CQR46733.1 Superoxide dismutase [Mn/Fe] [Paraliobacillus sp. PM-2]